MLYSMKFMQSLVARMLFDRREVNPRLKEKMKDGFPAFFEQSKHDPDYKEAFTDCIATERTDISTQLTHSGEYVTLDVVSIKPSEDYISRNPNNIDFPGKDRHIVMFPAAFDWYESFGCLTDNSLIAKSTGAEVHTFNYPGIHRSATKSKNVKVKEFNDLVNAGIAVVNKLIEDGVSPDKIILQGDCYGSAIAYVVKEEFEKKNIKVRIIAANTFSSFKNSILNALSKNSSFLLRFFLDKPRVKRILIETGWHLKVSKTFKSLSPYQMVIQRKQDKTLESSSLKQKLDIYDAQIKTKKRNDPCPREFMADREALLAKAEISLKEDELRRAGIQNAAEPKLQIMLKSIITNDSERKKFIIKAISEFVAAKDILEVFINGYKIKIEESIKQKIISTMYDVDTEENRKKVDAHPLSLYQFDGVFELIADYIRRSNRYIDSHKQEQPTKEKLPDFLQSSSKKAPLFHIVVEGILYSFIPLVLFFAIANPIVLPILLGTIGISLAGIGLTLTTIYLVGIPVITTCSIIFASGYIGHAFSTFGCLVKRFKESIIGLRRPHPNGSDKTTDDKLEKVSSDGSESPTSPVSLAVDTQLSKAQPADSANAVRVPIISKEIFSSSRRGSVSASNPEVATKIDIGIQVDAEEIEKAMKQESSLPATVLVEPVKADRPQRHIHQLLVR